MRKLMTTLATAVLAAGCAVGPSYQRPAVELPDQWPEGVRLSMDERADWREWWQRYGDPVLDRLVRQAVSDNLDLRAAAARVHEARASLGLSRANEYPSVQAQADATRGEASSPAQPTADGPSTTLGVAGTLAYELDLFGRLDRATEAAQARLLDNVFSRDAVRLTVITDVVTTYFQLRGTQAQIALTESTITSRREAYELEQVRYDNGASTELALRQAEAELESARARLPALREQASKLRRALAVLVGTPPRGLLAPERLETRALAALEPAVAVPKLLPSGLLQRRPDIRAAEAGLIAANADVGAAEAAWYPQLNLEATVGSEGLDVGDLFSGPAALWQLGGTVVQPLLDFGRRSARIEGAKARKEQAELQYRATLRDAFVEVGDALSSLRRAREELDVRARQVAALEEGVALAERRYSEGYSGYLEVLDARRALFEAQLSRTQAARTQLVATATLFKAMGGGWRPPTDLTDS